MIKSMTIENIGAYNRTGQMDQMIEKKMSVEAPQSPGLVELNNSSGNASGTSFASLFQNALEQTNQIQGEADRAVKELTAGRNKNIHETMLLIEKADSNFKMLMQVRNKLLDAYREVIRMQV
jgi:flagellar hook-basal body complex protein FliE